MSARAAAASTKVRLGPGAAAFPARSHPAVPPARFSHGPTEPAPQRPRLYPFPSRGHGLARTEERWARRARASRPPSPQSFPAACREGRAGGPHPPGPGRCPAGRPRRGLRPASHLLDVRAPAPGGGTAAAAGPCPREKPPRSLRCAGRALLFRAGAE